MNNLERNFKIPFQVNWVSLGVTTPAAAGLTFAIAGSLSVAGAVIAPTVASNLLTRYVIKIAAEDKISDLQRHLLVFGIACVSFAVTGLALATLGFGVPVVASVLGIGLIIAATNTFLFSSQKEVNDLKESRKDWKLAEDKIGEFEKLSIKYAEVNKTSYDVTKDDLLKAASSYKNGSSYLEYLKNCLAELEAATGVVEQLNEFHALYEEYAEVAKTDYSLSKETLKAEAQKHSAKNSENFKFIESRLSDLKNALVQQKELALQNRIDRKVEGYFFLWEELNKPKGHISYDDMRRKCQALGFYSQKSEDFLNAEYLKLKTKAQALYA